MSRNLSEVIPYLHVDNSHYVTTEGRIGTILECSGRNLGVMSREAALALAHSYGVVLHRLPTDVHLQILVTNHPMDAEEWVPHYMQQYASCPQRLIPVRHDFERRLREKLEGSHMPALRYYLCPSVQLPSRRKRWIRRQTDLIVRDGEYNSSLNKLLGVTEDLARALQTELGIFSHQLVRGEIIDLLHSFISPHWSNVHRVGESAVRSGISRDEELARGFVTLHEALGMGALDRYQDHIALDTVRVRSLSLTDYPESTRPGWLGNLMALPVSWRLSIQIQHLDKAREMARLKRELRIVSADNVPPDQVSDNQVAKIMKLLSYDPENMHREEDLAEYIDLLSTTDQRPFRISAHIAVSSPNRKQLDRDTKAVIESLSTDGSSIVDRHVIEQIPAWLVTLPGMLSPEAWRTPTQNVADTFPMLHNHAGTPNGILLGWSEPGQEAVLLDQWGEHAPNALMTLCGKGGSGKTTLAQRMALHRLMQGIKVIVFDHSDTAHWRDLTELVGGRHFFVSTDGEISINPFELRGNDLATWQQTGHVPSTRKLWLLELLGLMIGESGSLNADQLAIADECVQAIYSGNPNPHMSDLRAAFAVRADDISGQMANRLKAYVGGGMYGPFIDRDTNLDDAWPMIVFNFTKVNPRLVEVAMALLFDYVMERLRQSRERAFIPIDEGWAMLRHPIMGEFIEALAKKNRHTTASVLAMTQDIDDFASSPAAHAIVDNASVNFILQHNSNKHESLQRLFNLTESELEIIAGFGEVPNTFSNSDFGSSCWLHSRSGIERGKVRLWVTPEEYWLFTSAAQVKDEITIRRRSIQELGGDVWGACRALARHGAQ